MVEFEQSGQWRHVAAVAGGMSFGGGEQGRGEGGGQEGAWAAST
ncbi:hypothetical protein [Mycolicibacterium poriferae]|nr:hypothetical protein [Mycolicibacterium poriferae]